MALEDLVESARGEDVNLSVLAKFEKVLVTAHEVLGIAFDRGPEVAVVVGVGVHHGEPEFVWKGTLMLYLLSFFL